MRIAVVIAAFDERENIADLTRRLVAALAEIPSASKDLIFVVEGEDGTREILEHQAAERGGIRVLYRRKPSGLGNAFRRGFDAVDPETDLIVTMDADLNHAPEEIPRLVAEIERRKLDILIGSRFVRGSRSEGIPLWKSGLSAIMNRVIGQLFDVSIRDKTSGFRVFRASALRKILDYRNQDFAFLPEMLIRASERGLSMGEEPIHFRFRTRGRSKMDLAQTIGSYLALLRTRFDSLSVAALFVLAVGIAVRGIYAVPVHKYVPDADSVLSAIRALDILHGKIRIFYSHERIGALESYVHAVAYLLFGINRFAITIAPFLAGILSLLAYFFFVRELFGRRPAVFALIFFALPSPAYLAFTYMPNGYPETLLFCSLTLYFSARAARTGLTRWTAVALGLSAGVGLWNSFQTLMCAGPAIAWLLFVRRRDFRRNGRPILWMIGALLIGALPWIAYNARYDFPSLRKDLGGRPAESLSAIGPNTRYFFSYDVPELTLSTNPFAFEAGTTPFEHALRWPVGAVYLASAAVAIWFPLNRRRGPPVGLGRSGFVLLWMIAISVLLLDIVSEAGETRGLTVRYVLPLFLVFAAWAGVLADRAWQRKKVVAVGLVAVVCILNVSGYFFPWTDGRRYFRDLMLKDRALDAYLQKEGIRWVCGNYWIVYPVNFDTRGRVLGIPFEPLNDHYEYAAHLPARPVPWALVARNPTWLARWVAVSHLRGHTYAVGSGYHVFRPDSVEMRSRSPQKTLALLRSTVVWGH